MSVDIFQPMWGSKHICECAYPGNTMVITGCGAGTCRGSGHFLDEDGAQQRPLDRKLNFV